jgi:hypothetical protein
LHLTIERQSSYQVVEIQLEKELIAVYSPAACACLHYSLLRLLRNSHHGAGWLPRWFVTKTLLLLLRVYRQITAQTGNQSHAIIELHRAPHIAAGAAALRYSSHTRAPIIATTNSLQIVLKVDLARS